MHRDCYATILKCYVLDKVNKTKPGLMHWHADKYWPIWWCCKCRVLAKFRQCVLAIFAHKTVTLVFCPGCLENQVATL